MAPAQAAVTRLEELPVEKRSVKALQLQQLKRSFDLFAGNYGSKPDTDTARWVTTFGNSLELIAVVGAVLDEALKFAVWLLQSRS